MKYIIFKDEKSGLIQPVIFGEHTTHSQIKLERAKPISAGFFYMDAEKGICIHGESDSLSLKPKEGDEMYLLFVIIGAGTSSFIDLDKIEAPEK
ncbi:hypothetical protein [Dysgonomonas sp. Marseille-P4361]|uniref:hypothetical protein n=1 Tax=Dysgonomonas sp. Marseille-P4361 TaxID=2161820 RepID=UPI000D559419|nr:hypothetical protein [Dysgonomonas sp. Marseille-P4361]